MMGTLYIDVNREYIASPINSHLIIGTSSPKTGNTEDNIAFIKAELLALKSLVTEELYSLSQNLDRIQYDQSKIVEKDENLREEISSKDLIIKMLSESLSQVTNSFNKPKSIRSRGSTEKRC